MFRIVSLYLVLLLHVLDTSIANLALVTVARDLRIETLEGQWVVTSFGVGLGVAIAMAGRLATWAGERTVLTVALIGSAAASLGCGFATNFGEMVLLRAVHGLVSGLVLIVGQRLLVEVLGPEHKAFGLSLWSSAMAVAPVLGPVAGAAIIEQMSWRWVFWLNAPLVVLAMVALRGELELAPARRGPPPALLPPLMLGGLLISLEFLIDKVFAPAASSGQETALASLGVVVCLIGLVVSSRLSREAIFQWHVLKNGQFLAFTMIAVVINGLLLSTSVSLPVWLQIDYGLPLRQVAQVVAAGGIIAGVLSPLLGRVKSRQYFPWMVIAALWLLSVSFWLTAALQVESSMLQLIVPRLILGLALALFSPTAYLAIAKLPDKDFIAANGLSMFLRAALGNVIVAMSAGLLSRLDVSYLEEFVANGASSWFHLDAPPNLSSVASTAAVSADSRSMQAFFTVAAAVCFFFSLSVSMVWGLDLVRRRAQALPTLFRAKGATSESA
jgi:MFS family permease